MIETVLALALRSSYATCPTMILGERKKYSKTGEASQSFLRFKI